MLNVLLFFVVVVVVKLTRVCQMTFRKSKSQASETKFFSFRNYLNSMIQYNAL